MQRTITGLFIIIGIIHILPMIGILGAERLSSLYGIVIEEPNLTILMQHRAVLFGLLGVFFIFSAFQPAWQPIAFAAGFISVVSFLIIVWISPEFNAAIRKVVVADLIALICLIVATIFYWISLRQT